MPPPENGLTPVFNNLSFWDRWKLRMSALTEFVTGVARDDTRAHPERFPLYACYFVLLGAAMTLSPVPGTTEALILGTIGIVRKSRSPWAEWVDGRLKAAFNKEALVADHRAFIEPDKKKEGRFRVQNCKLFGHTTRTGLGNVWETVRAAFPGRKKPPDPPASPPPP